MKDLLTSKTAIGTFVSMAAILAQQLGYDIGDQEGLVNSIVAIFGAMFALYGRVVAVTPIGSVAGVKVNKEK